MEKPPVGIPIGTPDLQVFLPQVPVMQVKEPHSTSLRLRVFPSEAPDIMREVKSPLCLSMSLAYTSMGKKMVVVINH